jgi:succinate-acetate transporter protein
LLPAITASVLTFGLFWATPRFNIFNPVRTNRAAQSTTSETGGYGFLWGIYQFVSQISSTISNTLEGDGGLMWTLLFLVLFVSLMTQGGF